jgi:hypothetical protein
LVLSAQSLGERRSEEQRSPELRGHLGSVKRETETETER